MNRVLVVFSDGLLSELDSARGLVSRSAWIRQAVETQLMKEAVAPLVPMNGLVPADEVYSEIPIGGGVKRQPKSKTVKDSPAVKGLSDGTKRGDGTPQSALIPAESPSALPRTVKRLSGRKIVEEQIPRRPEVKVKFDAIAPIPCTCGGKIYQIGSRKGQCSNCSKPTPKESE